MGHLNRPGPREGAAARGSSASVAPVFAEQAGLPVVPGPDWPGVRCFCTTRAGGAGSAPYDTLNLGMKAGDDPATVDENRRRLRAAVPSDPFWLAQVHGSRVLDADAPGDDRQADASVTATPGTVLAILTADCLPVVITDADARVLGAAHAGWRGLAGGVLENTLRALCDRHPRARGWRAWIAPGIGPAAFEVGSDVREAFAPDGAAALAAFARRAGVPGKWMADLPRLAELRLRRAGVEQVIQSGLCTASHPELFFSYRRDGRTGRMATLAWLLVYPD